MLALVTKIITICHHHHQDHHHQDHHHALSLINVNDCQCLEIVTHPMKTDRAVNIGKEGRGRYCPQSSHWKTFTLKIRKSIYPKSRKKFQRLFFCFSYLQPEAFQLLILTISFFSSPLSRMCAKSVLFFSKLSLCGFEDYPTLSLWFPRPPLSPPLSNTWTEANRPCH